MDARALLRVTGRRAAKEALYGGLARVSHETEGAELVLWERHVINCAVLGESALEGASVIDECGRGRGLARGGGLKAGRGGGLGGSGPCVSHGTGGAEAIGGWRSRA